VYELPWIHPNGLFGNQSYDDIDDAEYDRHQMLKDGCSVDTNYLNEEE